MEGKFQFNLSLILKHCSLLLIALIIFAPYLYVAAFDIPDEKVEELRIKYKATIVDGVLKIKDRKQLYNAGEELLTRVFENNKVRIEAIYQPPPQIDNRMNYLLSTGNIDEFLFFDKLYGPNGIFTKYYSKSDYLYFAFRITSKSGKKIDTDKFIKKLKLYDGLGNMVKGEKPRLFSYDESKKQRVYENENWTTLPGFEDKGFIWVAFPKKKLKEDAGVYYIEVKRFGGAKKIELLWTLPIRLPQCRC